MATTDRVFTSKEKGDLFLKLSKTKQKTDAGLFDNNKDLFLLAAAIGFKDNRKRPLLKKDGEIPLSVFQKSKDNLDFIDLVALGDTKDVYILDWDDEDMVDKKLRIIEEYANRGLEIIEERLYNNNTDIFDNLLQLINCELSGESHFNNIGDLKNIIELI
jgi:dnd system-associated protein 4